MNNDNRLHYFLSKPEQEYYCLYYSILRLEKVNGCEEIVSELTKKLEELFANVPEHECVKELDNLIYYENGLIERRGDYGGVIASPWKSTVVIKEPTAKKQKPKKHSFYYLKYQLKRGQRYSRYYDTVRLGISLFYQMRLYNKSSIAYSKLKIDFVSFLKKAEAFTMLSKEERMLTGIYFPLESMYKIFHELKEFLGEGNYFSDAQCEDIMLIYDTFPDKDIAESWRSNELTENCDKYLRNSTLYNIGKDFNKVNKYINNLNKTDDLFYEKIINCSVEVYKELYNIKETNMRTLLLKLGIIEEGYIPFDNSSEKASE